MYNVYKVTAAHIKKTLKGYTLYKLQLDNSIWATKLIPLSKMDQIFDPLYQKYIENSKNIDFLVGQYISVNLENSNFGVNFGKIISFDALQDFKKLLDESQGKAFITNINIFDLLQKRGHSINLDGTITLRDPYSKHNIKLHEERTVCYPNKPEENTLTLSNLGFIYEEFFKDKYIDNGNPDRDEQYALTPVAIVMTRRIFHKSKSSVISNNTFNVLRIGDRLSEEHCRFLSRLESTKTQ